MSNPPRIAETLRIMEVVFPNTTNHYGTMFGGKVLDLMDRAAFLAATRFSNQAMVTASTEHIDFYVPVKAGYIVELVAKVVYSGRTSLTVRVDLFSENPIKKQREHASQGYFHMVSVDENGKPVPVPDLKVDTPDEKAEWDNALSLCKDQKSRRQKNKFK